MNIPTLSPENVTPSNILPTPQRSMSSPVSQAIEGTGRALQGVGQDFKEAAFQADKTFTQGQLAEYNKENLDLFNGKYEGKDDPDDPKKKKTVKGFLQAQGEQAIDIVDSGLAAHKQLRAKYLEGMSNESQRRMFTQHTLEDENRIHADLLRHSAKEFKVVETKNRAALLESQEQLASTQWTNWPELEKTATAAATTVYDGKLTEGFGHDHPETAQAVKEVKSKIYANAIEQMMLADPKLADQKLNQEKIRDKILPNTLLKIDRELAPKLDASQIGDIVSKAMKSAKSDDPSAPMDVSKANAEVEKLTDKPHIQKLAYEKIEHLHKLKQQSDKDQADYYGGALIDKWESNPSMTVADIMKEEEYGKLSVTQQGKIKAKIRQNIEHRDTVERQTVSGERSAAAAARSAATAAETERRVASENSTFKLIADQERLSRMTDGEYKVERAGLRPQEQIKLDEARKKVKDPKHLKDANEHKEVVDTVLSSIPGFEGDEAKILSGRILYKLGELQNTKGSKLTDEETRDATIKFAQMQWVKEKHLFGDKVVPKRGISVSKEDKPATRPKEMQDRLDAVGGKRGKKLTPEQETALEQAIISEMKAKK